MEASTSFQNILAKIQASNLNFKLELSPFSAVIWLKKSFVKDKIGRHVALDEAQADVHDQSDIQTLSQKYQNLEKAYQRLQCDYQEALDYSEEVRIDNQNLKTELELKMSEQNFIGLSDFNALKMKLKKSEEEVNVKSAQIKGIVEQNRNLKIEVSNANNKNEKIKIEIHELKTEKDKCETKVKNLSVALKSAKAESKETNQRFNNERKHLEQKLEVLTSFKIQHEADAKEFKKKQKKLNKKSKRETKEAAKFEVNRMKDCRNQIDVEQNNNADDLNDTSEADTRTTDDSTKDSNDTSRTEPLAQSSPSPQFQNNPKLMSAQKFKELTEKHFGAIAFQSILEVFAKVEENCEQEDKTFIDVPSKVL